MYNSSCHEILGMRFCLTKIVRSVYLACSHALSDRSLYSCSFGILVLELLALLSLPPATNASGALAAAKLLFDMPVLNEYTFLN